MKELKVIYNLYVDIIYIVVYRLMKDRGDLICVCFFVKGIVLGVLLVCNVFWFKLRLLIRKFLIN